MPIPISRRRLVALLEAPAVGYAAEGTGDQLGIIHIAEAEEYLVFLRDIEIDAGIKGIAMFEKVGIGSEV